MATRLEDRAKKLTESQKKIDAKIAAAAKTRADYKKAGVLLFPGDYNPVTRSVDLYSVETAKKSAVVQGKNIEDVSARISSIIDEYTALQAMAEDVEVAAVEDVAAKNDAMKAAHLAALNKSVPKPDPTQKEG